MAELLAFTMVSKKWRECIINAPPLWATIDVSDTDDDALATIVAFFHLSRIVLLSLIVWAFLSNA